MNDPYLKSEAVHVTLSLTTEGSELREPKNPTGTAAPTPQKHNESRVASSLEWAFLRKRVLFCIP